eukprot:TRINITY_DN3502_c0_g2_i1.p1 TRINITY_DN3502_c0_g2~~TRINITY_DN3502_c0_g2_i1.p1  ORF type:complete len:431 (+),score=79.85 TRINITY_DN3502_c0_g2_i1:79-1293(+)
MTRLIHEAAETGGCALLSKEEENKFLPGRDTALENNGCRLKVRCEEVIESVQDKICAGRREGMARVIGRGSRMTLFDVTNLTKLRKTLPGLSGPVRFQVLEQIFSIFSAVEGVLSPHIASTTIDNIYLTKLMMPVLVPTPCEHREVLPLISCFTCLPCRWNTGLFSALKIVEKRVSETDWDVVEVTTFLRKTRRKCLACACGCGRVKGRFDEVVPCANEEEVHFTCLPCAKAGQGNCTKCGTGLNRRDMARAGLSPGDSEVFTKVKKSQREGSLPRPATSITEQINAILTLSCPTGCAFPLTLDGVPVFDGCTALECRTCATHFCGWCLQSQTPAEAHRHVLHCRENPSPGSIESPFETFESHHKKKQAEQVSAVLRQAATTPEMLVEAKHFLEAHNVPDFGLW